MTISQAFTPDNIDKLFKAKAVYGQLFLFKDQDILSIFRPLTTAECETIVSIASKLNEVYIEDWIFRTTLIISNHNIDYLLNRTPCFYVKNISTKILLLSNAQEEKSYKKLLYKGREKAKTLQNVMEILIAKAYHSLTHDEIKNLTQVKQIELLCKSEGILGEALQLNEKKEARRALRKFIPGAEVIGGDITSPEAADKPDFNESI